MAEPKFLTFFELVQDAARRRGKVFFLDYGDGHEFENDELEGEDLAGWLVDEADADEFEAIFLTGTNEPGPKFDGNYCWAEWENGPDGLSISFESYEVM